MSSNLSRGRQNPVPLARRSYLGIEGASGVAEVLCVAEDEARQDLLLLDALQPQFEVLPGGGIVRLHVVTQQTEHLHGVLAQSLQMGVITGVLCFPVSLCK